MKIGIASPISVKALSKYLNNLSIEDIELGLGGNAINNLIIALLNLGHYVSVYTLDWNVKRKESKILKGDKLTIYIGQFRHFNKFNKLKLIDFMHFESIQIKSFICIDNPDIVNAHWTYEYAVGAIMSKYPHLLTFRDDSVTILKISKSLYRFIRLIIDHWVRFNGKNFSVNSLYLKNKIYIRRKEIPVCVIPNPISPDIEFGHVKNINHAHKIRIVSILNGWGKLKNAQTALKAIKLLKTRMPALSIEYHLFGPGYESNSYGQKWCEGKSLDENVFFHGFCDHSELMANLENYDIMLHPSIEESFGNTLIEALAKGLPVVAGRDSGAVPWVLRNGENGILVDVHNPEEIVHGIFQLIRDKDLYSSLSKKGIEYVNNTYLGRNIALKYIELYERIIADE